MVAELVTLVVFRKGSFILCVLGREWLVVLCFFSVSSVSSAVKQLLQTQESMTTNRHTLPVRQSARYEFGLVVLLFLTWGTVFLDRMSLLYLAPFIAPRPPPEPHRSWIAGFGSRPRLGLFRAGVWRYFRPHRPPPGSGALRFCIFGSVLAPRSSAIFRRAVHGPHTDGGCRGSDVVDHNRHGRGIFRS
jgi:hypothetical protein